MSKHLVIGITYFSFSYYFSKFIFIQVYFMFRSVSKHLVIGMNNFYFYSSLVDLFLIKYFWLSEGCHSKHIVIGKNNFYFSSCFSRFIFNQEFLAFRSVSKHLVIGVFFLTSANLFLFKYFSCSEVCHAKHLVIGMNNFYFYSTFSIFIFNQVFLTFRRVSLKTQSYWEDFSPCFSNLLFQEFFFRSVQNT